MYQAEIVKSAYGKRNIFFNFKDRWAKSGCNEI